MKGFLNILLICSAFCITWMQAAEETIDEAIFAAELKSTDAQMLQPDHTILTEGDMRLTPKQFKALQDLRSGDVRKKRNALRDIQKRWTNGVVPYAFAGVFTVKDVAVIKEGVNEWNKFSCVHIREYKNSDPHAIKVVPDGGCSSSVGMTGQKLQRLTLGRGCIYKGVVAHEFGHALGFHHEQTRPDRDSHVRIVEANINPKMLYNFKKYDWNKIDAFDVPYDYESVMHYGKTAFSTNRKITIQTLDKKYQDVIGNRYGISFFDIKLINLMYKCNEKCPKKQCPGSGFVGKDCKCWCKGPNIRSPAIYCDSKEPVAGGNTVGMMPMQDAVTDNHENWMMPMQDAVTDNHENCPAWAAHGECQKNPGYMLVNCKKSCANAGGSGANFSCKDTIKECGYWKKKGMCTDPQFKKEMEGNCKATCGRC